MFRIRYYMCACPRAFAEAGFVGDECISLHLRQQMISAHQVMGLAAGQEEVDRVAERIGQGMDLGAQSAARAPDRLVLADFFWAPALC